MAKKGGERRLLFDTRGRRRHVIRVVYAVLAILMGTSLFLVIGPVNLTELLGNSSSSGSAAEVFEEQTERIEGRLAREPKNPQLVLTLTRAQINTGNAKAEPAAAGQTVPISPEAHGDFEAARESWNRYLKLAEKAGEKPSAAAAQLIAGTFFRVAEAGSTSLGEIEENVAVAAKAQKLAAEQQPSLGSLSSLAIYQYFNGEFSAGDKTTKEVAAKAGSKTQAKEIEKQLATYRQNAKKFKEGAKKAAKLEQGASKEALQNPFGGLGGAGGAAGE
jgi:hypothetical protein